MKKEYFRMTAKVDEGCSRIENPKFSLSLVYVFLPVNYGVWVLMHNGTSTLKEDTWRDISSITSPTVMVKWQ